MTEPPGETEEPRKDVLVPGMPPVPAETPEEVQILPWSVTTHLHFALGEYCR